MNTTAGLALLGGGGALAWFTVIGPELERRRMQAFIDAEALAYEKAHPGSPISDAAAAIGAAACKAFAATQGAPSAVSGNACAALAKLTVVGLRYAGKGTVAVAKGVAHVGAAAGKTTAHVAASAAKGVGKGATTVGKAVGKSTATVAKTTAHVVSKLKFWGLEGLDEGERGARWHAAPHRRNSAFWRGLAGY